MLGYQCYLLGEGLRILTRRDFYADSDTEALATARKLSSEPKPHSFELWVGARYLCGEAIIDPAATDLADRRNSTQVTTIAGTATRQAPAAERYACPPEERVAHPPACYQDGIVSEAQRLREKAAHAREMAGPLTDAHAHAALQSLASELEQQALDLERQEQSGQRRPASRIDTP